jgi:hypothetical protein
MEIPLPKLGLHRVTHTIFSDVNQNYGVAGFYYFLAGEKILILSAAEDENARSGQRVVYFVLSMAKLVVSSDEIITLSVVPCS